MSEKDGILFPLDLFLTAVELTENVVNYRIILYANPAFNKIFIWGATE